MLQRTQKVAGSCNDGPCPAIHETTETGTLAIQGYIPSPEELTAMGLPEGESVVLVPHSLLSQYGQR